MSVFPNQVLVFKLTFYWWLPNCGSNLSYLLGLNPLLFHMSSFLLNEVFFLLPQTWLYVCNADFSCVSRLCPQVRSRRKTSWWPRRPIRAQFRCCVPLGVVSMVTQGPMVCALFATKSTYQGRITEELRLWVQWVRTVVFFSTLQQIVVSPLVLGQ